MAIGELKMYVTVHNRWYLPHLLTMGKIAVFLGADPCKVARWVANKGTFITTETSHPEGH